MNCRVSRETTPLFLAKASLAPFTDFFISFSYLFHFFFDSFPPVERAPVPTILKQNLFTPPTGVTGEGSFRQFRHPKKHEVKRQFRPRLLFSPSARGTGPRPDHPYNVCFTFSVAVSSSPIPTRQRISNDTLIPPALFVLTSLHPLFQKNRFRCSYSFYNLHSPLEAYPSFILFYIGIERRFRLLLFFFSPPPFLACLFYHKIMPPSAHTHTSSSFFTIRPWNGPPSRRSSKNFFSFSVPIPTRKGSRMIRRFRPPPFFSIPTPSPILQKKMKHPRVPPWSLFLDFSKKLRQEARSRKFCFKKRKNI